MSDRGQFLADLIHAAHIDHPLVVSPSMSGTYALPYMVQPDGTSCQERMLAYVPVAPGTADAFPVEAYKQCQVGPQFLIQQPPPPSLICFFLRISLPFQIPVMIYLGANDRSGPQIKKVLSNMPNHQVIEIQGAGHPAYIDKPEEWSQALYTFMKFLENSSH